MAEAHVPGIAILASGSGTTAEAFIHATQAGIVDAEVGLVVTNNSQAGVKTAVDRLNQQYGLDIRTAHISGATHPDGAGQRGEQTLQEAAAICELLSEDTFSLVALMGYMKKVRGELLAEYGSLPEHQSIYEASAVNTHPGPLPLTSGLMGEAAQAKAIASGWGYSAQTLHVVAEEYDSGMVIAEHRVPVLPADTPDSLFKAVQLTEKTHLPVDIGRFLKGDDY